MNITKGIINDLIPLYAANECSADTRALVEEYLRQHPQEAAELRRIMNTPMPGPVASEKNLQEMESLRKARQHIRHWSWLVGAAIYFSLAPFSFVFHKDGHYWLFRESPTGAIIYGAIGVGFWVAYLVTRSRSRIL